MHHRKSAIVKIQAAIIAIVIVIAAVAGVFAYYTYFAPKPPPAPPTPSPTPTKPEMPTPIPEEEYIQVSAYEFAMKLFDKKLTELQREEIWKEYKGKHVRWVSELLGVAKAKDGAVATFWVGSYIDVTFPESQKKTLLELDKGDLVIYTGELEFYESYNGRIRLRDGSIISLALVPLWSKELKCILVPPWSTESDLIVVDKVFYASAYIGTYGLLALNAETGETMWERSNFTEIPPVELKGYYYENLFGGIVGIDVRHLYIWWKVKGLLPFFTLQALDRKTGETVWWERYKTQYTFPNGMPTAPSIQEVLKEKGIELVPHHVFGEEANTDEVLFSFSKYGSMLYAKDSVSQRVLWVKGVGGVSLVAVEGDLLYLYLYLSKDLIVFRLQGIDLWRFTVATPTLTPLPVSVTKADLLEALKDLREAMLKKLDWDIGNTAIAFTDVKDYWRAKRWADIFTAPLRVIEDTLILLAKAADLKSLTQEADAALDESEAAYQVLSVVMMLHDLQKVGEKLQYGLDGPTYVAAIESMLEEADATFIPPSGDDWQENYKKVIGNHLYGTAEDTPLRIPRRSTTADRKIVEFVSGALQVRINIAKKLNDLIAEIESRELPKGFPIDEVTAQVKELTKQVVKSMSYGTDVRYKAYLQDGERYVETKLGAVGELYRLFGQVARQLDKKLAIEERVEVLKLKDALLYIITYKVPGVEEIKVVQMATTLAEVIIKPYQNTFYTDVEEKFYMLPQEMVLSLPIELSNLWMIANDTDQYVRYLLVSS